MVFSSARMPEVGDRTDPELLERLRRFPQQHVALIVTVDGDPHLYERAVQALGLTVRRTFGLTHQMAVEGAAHDFEALGRESWVVKMEEDKPVRAMG